MKNRNKTALVLGGGGSRGAYEIGVWKALTELDIKIDIVTGTSVGAINGALVVQGDLKTAEQLWKELETDMVFDIEKEDMLTYIKTFLTKGGAGTEGLKKLLSENIDEKKVRDSTIDFGLITVSINDFKSHELLKKDIPEGKLIPYIMASAACFPASKFQEIDDVKFVDGGYSDNIPVGLALKAGAERVIAVDLDAVGVTNKEELKKIEDLVLIESRWNLGNFLVFDKQNSNRIMQLGYLNTMKVLGPYEGDRYTFKKGEYDKRKMRGLDEAGDFFEVDPLCVYEHKEFNESLKAKIDEFKKLAEATNILIKEGVHSANNKMLTLVIARSLKYNLDENNFFLSKTAMQILKPQITAANYLLKYDLY